MPALRFILGDQLTREISSLDRLDKNRDIVLMVEAVAETTYVRHHKQKIAFVLSAMRHFADALRREGVKVRYVKLDDERNTGSLTGELGRALGEADIDRIVITEPGEWRVLEIIRAWQETFTRPVEIRPDTRFLCTAAEFTTWAEGRKNLRMEFFYREMRRKSGWLMDGDKPLGGKWNYDAQNRRRLGDDVELPARIRFPPDEVTKPVLDLVEKQFPDHFGDVDGFAWGTTREDALTALDHFTASCLQLFGDYQDAMKSDHDFLFHSLVSPYLNIGLLTAAEVCETVLKAAASSLYCDSSLSGNSSSQNSGRLPLAGDEMTMPLNAVEGFIRQILGWREYIRGIYWLKMPGYRETNFLAAKRPLPAFYWTAETDMHCIAQVVSATRRNAYAHHIQRLMVTGNFALLAGISPVQVEDWYLAVYADAYEWVELPNTHGMALFADGGVLGSKPYAASGAYINRMSDYCARCTFDPKQKLGPKACPFNYLYWHFIIRNESRLAGNPRMAMPYRTLKKMDQAKRTKAILQAEQFLEVLH